MRVSPSCGRKHILPAATAQLRASVLAHSYGSPLAPPLPTHAAAAEAALAAQPDILINRIVAQFQRLFGCRSLEGVLPAMNKLYLQHTGESEA